MKTLFDKSVFRGLLAAVFLSGCLSMAFAATAATDFNFFADDLIAKESYRKISMDFRDASLKDIFKIFSEQSGLNFIASESVRDRTLTLFLDQVPLQEALNKIMRANNLTYDLDPGSNIFIVRETGLPEVELVTKVYYLKYARSKTSNLQKEIASASSGSGAGGGEGGSGGGGGGGGASSESSGSDILDSVKHVLSSQGKAIFDSRTNSLIVTDMPVQFDAIERIIALLDTPIPQVLIEVEMLDVSKRTIDEIGVNMSKSLIQYTGSDVSSATPGFLFNQKFAPEADPSFTYGTISTSIFTALFDYLTTDSKTKFLARPRIMTLSNETAEIKITTDEAIGQNTVTVSAEGDTGSTSVEAERVETGVSLRVTPQVDPVSGYVTMVVVPTVSEAKAGATFNNTTYKDPETRTSSSTLMVKNGETVVVGGLIRNKDELTIKKMPVLGDIPIIGAAFRHKDRTVEERELLVFLTPRIVGYENKATLAKGDMAFPQASSTVEYREQATPVSRKAQVSDMLERWE